MITALVLAGIAAASLITVEKAVRCTVQQVHLPAGKIGPITTIERCKHGSDVAKQDVRPAAEKPAGVASN